MGIIKNCINITKEFILLKINVKCIVKSHINN